MNNFLDSESWNRNVETRAYFLWEQAGRPDGDGSHFWSEAESQLRKELLDSDKDRPATPQTPEEPNAVELAEKPMRRPRGALKSPVSAKRAKSGPKKKASRTTDSETPVKERKAGKSGKSVKSSQKTKDPVDSSKPVLDESSPSSKSGSSSKPKKHKKSSKKK